MALSDSRRLACRSATRGATCWHTMLVMIGSYSRPEGPGAAAIASSGLGGEYLVDRGPAGGEPGAGGPQVQLPHPGALLAGEAHRLVIARLVALDPVGEGARVVLGQPPHVAHA